MLLKTITAKELQEKINNKEDFVLIDCRELEDWKQGHIKNSINIPSSDFNSGISRLNDSNIEVIVYCQNGTRSTRACFTLISKGFTNVCNFDGGITEWLQSQYQLEGKQDN